MRRKSLAASSAPFVTTNKGKSSIDDNYFIETVLPGFIVRPLAKEVHDVYRQSIQALKSRTQVNQ